MNMKYRSIILVRSYDNGRVIANITARAGTLADAEYINRCFCFPDDDTRWHELAIEVQVQVGHRAMWLDVNALNRIIESLNRPRSRPAGSKGNEIADYLDAKRDDTLVLGKKVKHVPLSTHEDYSDE
jgi:hypothetical protein